MHRTLLDRAVERSLARPREAACHAVLGGVFRDVPSEVVALIFRWLFLVAPALGLHEARARSRRDAVALASTSRAFLHVLRNDSELSVELAARNLALVPGAALLRESATPWTNQVVLLTRTAVLTQAFVMLCQSGAFHCAGAHCDVARRAFLRRAPVEELRAATQAKFVFDIAVRPTETLTVAAETSLGDDASVLLCDRHALLRRGRSVVCVEKPSLASSDALWHFELSQDALLYGSSGDAQTLLLLWPLSDSPDEHVAEIVRHDKNKGAFASLMHLRCRSAHVFVESGERGEGIALCEIRARRCRYDEGPGNAPGPWREEMWVHRRMLCDEEAASPPAGLVDGAACRLSSARAVSSLPTHRGDAVVLVTNVHEPTADGIPRRAIIVAPTRVRADMDARTVHTIVIPRGTIPEAPILFSHECNGVTACTGRELIALFCANREWRALCLVSPEQCMPLTVSRSPCETVSVAFFPTHLRIYSHPHASSGVLGVLNRSLKVCTLVSSVPRNVQWLTHDALLVVCACNDVLRLQLR